MNQEDKSFEFSELAMLYCRNWQVVKTLAQRWRAETDELVHRLKEKLDKYKDQWNIYLSNTYGWVRKRTWGTAITYNLWFDQGRIGKGTIGISIQVKDKELRKKVCEALETEIYETFGQKANPGRESIVNIHDKEIGDKNYEDAIVQAIQLWIDFSSNLDQIVFEGLTKT